MKNKFILHLFAVGTLAASSFAYPALAADAETTPVQTTQAKPSDLLAAPAALAVDAKPTIVKAAQNLRIGTVLHASDLVVEGDDPFATDPFVGMEVKRSIYVGRTLTSNDVGPPTAIARNDIVNLEFERGPLTISTEGRALDAGAVGEAVRVMNLSSKIILTAVVTGTNTARAQ